MTILKFYVLVMFVATIMSFSMIFASKGNPIVDMFFLVCWICLCTFDDWERWENHKLALRGGA